MSRLILPRPIFPRPFLWIPKLEFAGGYPCCCDDCPCSVCSGASPCCWKVVISGVVEGSCGDCECIDGTYFVPYSTACDWTRTLSGAPCTDGVIQVTVFLDGSDYKLQVKVGDNTWIKNYGASKPSCRTLVDESIAFSSSEADCDASSSTCLVTAVSSDSAVNCPPKNYLCDQCICNATPTSWQVTIAGMVDTDPATGCDCEQLNQTYIVSNPFGLLCQWNFTFSSDICLVHTVHLQISATHTIFVDLRSISNNTITRWTDTTRSADFLCCELDNNPLTFISSLISGCDASSSTVTITALC